MPCALLLLSLPVLAWSFLGWLAGGLLPVRGELRTGWWWVVVGLPTLVVLFVGATTLLVTWGIVREHGWFGRLVEAYRDIGVRMVDAARAVVEAIFAGLAGLLPPLAPFLLGVR